MKKVIYILAIATGLASCNGTNKISKSADNQSDISRKKPVCGKLHVDMNKPHIDWYEENSTVLNKSTELLVLPQNYKVYSIDTAQLNSFFDAIAKNQLVSTTVPLPKPADCQLFEVRHHTFKGVYTMANATTAKGVAKGQELALQYKNGNLEGLISWFELEYRIVTKYIEGKPYYIVYTEENLPESTNETEDKPLKLAPLRQDYVK